MEGMDMDYYVVECVIRDRLRGARAKARTAALLLQANTRPPSKGIETRLADFGSALVSWARRVGAEIPRALPRRMPRARHPRAALPARRSS